jgi:hypothetical protein
MALSKAECEAKLQKLAELEGFETVDQMFDAAVSDSVCPGICVNPSCDYTTEVEPDQRKGYCEKMRNADGEELSCARGAHLTRDSPDTGFRGLDFDPFERARQGCRGRNVG